MAFFFEYSPSVFAGVPDIMEHIKHGSWRHILNSFYGNPVERIGNTIIVYVHSQWHFKIADFENFGFTIGAGLHFKVTRLYPWNHPKDNLARALWKAHTETSMNDLATSLEDTASLDDSASLDKHEYETDYMDEEGNPVPPPPKLQRTSNEPHWLDSLDTTEYFDSMGRPVPPPPKLLRTTNEPQWMYNLEYESDSLPSLVDIQDLDNSPLAPFSPRGSSSSSTSFPDPLIL
jgi:hypothetical protein